MRIPTNETVLRENLHSAVDNLSLVNIVILFMLIRVVQVVSYLRPGERDLASLPAPRPELSDGEQGTGPELDRRGGWYTVDAPLEPQWDSQGRFRPEPLPFPYTGANDIAGITVGSNPEPGSSKISLTLADGREVSFLEWHMDVERQRRSLNSAQYGGAYADFSTINVEIDSPFQGGHGSYITSVPILGWAENDCGERIVMLRHPGDGLFQLMNFDATGPTIERGCDRPPINAIHYSMESLQYQCERGNDMLRESLQGRRGTMLGYCTPSRHGMFTNGEYAIGGGSDRPYVYEGGHVPDFPHVCNYRDHSN